MGQIRKIQKHKEERERSGKFKKKTKKEGKNEGKKKKRFLPDMEVGSHTRVFSIGHKRPPWGLLLPSCSNSPSLRRIHSNGG
jgi:hypothetical protein